MNKLYFKRAVTFLLVLVMVTLNITSCFNNNESNSDTTLNQDTTINADTTVPVYVENAVDYVEEENNMQNDIDFSKFVNTGSWTYENGELSGQNKSTGDSFAISSLNIKSDMYLSVEADVTIDGKGCGIIFGIENQSTTIPRWCSFNYDKNMKLSRVFRVLNGSAISPARISLNTAECSWTNFKMKLEIFPDRTMLLWLNDELRSSFVFPEEYEGYIGFYTYWSNAVFKNIVIKTDVPENGIETLSDTDNFMRNEFSENSFCYAIDVPEDDDKVVLNLKSAEGYANFYEGNQIINGQLEITPPVGFSRVEIVSQNKENNKHTNYTLLIFNKDDDKYESLYRPQFHFSPYYNFMNDPNGLCYNALTGEYHMYFQYNPYDISMGNQAWGHAVSTDLVHWEEQSIAIEQDEIGRIYSGSAVIDYNNTSGFFDESTPPEARMVAVYSYHTQQVAIAYSIDNGTSFIKYTGNPVIESGEFSGGFRDPKVIWIEDASLQNGGIWLMVIAGGRAQLYTSTDLIHWEYNSAINKIDNTPLESECPDLFPLPLDGDDSNVKWVYFGAGKFYIIGDLVKNSAGKYEFVAETDSLPYIQSNSIYATQSFFNDKSGRRLMVSWLKDYTASAIPNKTWNGMQSIVTEAKLVTIDGKMSIISLPVEELESIRVSEPLLSVNNVSINASGQNILSEIDCDFCEIELKIAMENASSFQLVLKNNGSQSVVITYIKSNNLLSLYSSPSIYCGSSSLSTTLEPDDDGNITLRVFVDNCVIDVFSLDGTARLNALTFLNPNQNNMSLNVFGGSILVKELNVYEMDAIS